MIWNFRHWEVAGAAVQAGSSRIVLFCSQNKCRQPMACTADTTDRSQNNSFTSPRQWKISARPVRLDSSREL